MGRKLIASVFLQTCEPTAPALCGLPDKKLKVLGKQAFYFSSVRGVRSQGKQSQDIYLSLGD